MSDVDRSPVAEAPDEIRAVGAYAILRRGMAASPELRDGLVFTALMALAVAHALQCPYCIDSYPQKSLENGAALDQMTRSMAVALAPHRIRVNAVAFGSVMSASLKSTLKDHSEYRADIEDHTPMGRIAAPGELSETVQYLCSDAASFMTGQIMTVDGGRTLLDPVTAPAH